MAKNRILILVILLSGCIPGFKNPVLGQSLKTFDIGKVIMDSENEKSQAVQNSFGYEFGGKGLGFSIFYERRLLVVPNGIGISGGIGIAEWDISYLTIPLQVNYLIGGDHCFLEVGTGLTYMRNNIAQEDGHFQVVAIEIPNKNVNTFFWTISAGFRGEFGDGRNNGFGVFRIGITPFFAYNQWSAMIYVSLGGGK